MSWPAHTRQALLSACLLPKALSWRAEDSEDGDFFYDEDEVAAGAGGADRVARLNALDALLTMPRADQLDEVRGGLTAWQSARDERQDAQAISIFPASCWRTTRASRTLRRRRRRRRRTGRQRMAAIQPPRVEQVGLPPLGWPPVFAVP